VSGKKIRIFVEGINDARFFDWIISRYYQVFPVPYQQKKNRIVCKYIEEAKSKEDHDYVFLADMDSHSYSCVESKINKRKDEYDALDDDDRIIIVREEIESWYIAGICDNCPNDIKIISIPTNTENFTKEDFEKIIPSRFENSDIDFMIEIGKCFDLELAKSRNDSFSRLIKKLDELNILY